MALITGANLAAHLNISDNVDDAALAAAASAASVQVVRWCDNGGFDKTAVGSETARVFRPRDQLVCVVDDFHDTTNLVVKTDDDETGTYETTWTVTTDYILEPLNGRQYGQTWSYNRVVAVGDRRFTCSDRATVQLTAAWGWATPPDAVVQAALIQAARIFKRRTSPEGVLGGFGEFGAVRVSARMDPDVALLLQPYRRTSAIGIA